MYDILIQLIATSLRELDYGQERDEAGFFQGDMPLECPAVGQTWLV